MLTGTHVALRALEPEDLPLLQKWRNNAHMRRFYREYRELAMYDQESWYKAICCGNRHFCMFGVVFHPQETTKIAKNAPQPGQLLGVFGLTNIHWVLRSAEASFYIGHDDLYCDAIYTPDAFTVMVRYAFDVLNMHKVWAEIYDFDTQKQELFASMGLHKEGEIRDNAFDGGRYSNSLIYSLLETEYKNTPLSQP